MARHGTFKSAITTGICLGFIVSVWAAAAVAQTPDAPAGTERLRYNPVDANPQKMEKEINEAVEKMIKEFDKKLEKANKK